MEASKDDVKIIIDVIKRFMPDFPITKGDLVNIKSSFVIAFYHRYLNEIKRNCGTLFNNDGDLKDVLDKCPRGIEPEMFLFLQTRDLLNRIGISYFTICDFYRPSNRTRLTMKVCLNFLLYIKENLPKAQALVQNFNDKVKDSVSKTEKIQEKKNLIVELSHHMGLKKEKLCLLQRELNAEENLQVTPGRPQIKLDNEIEELEKKLEDLKIHIRSQEHRKSILDVQINELNSELVSDNYETQKGILEYMEIKVKEDKNAILKSEKLLEEKHKELIYITDCTTLLQNCNISALDNVEQNYNLKQKLKELESVRDKTRLVIDDKQAELEMRKQHLLEMEKKYTQDIKDLKTTLSKVNTQYDMSIQQLYFEKELHRDLEEKASSLKKQIGDSERKYAELEEEQVVIQTELQRIYQKMLSSQNMITTSFNNALSKFQ